jgi:hypothetical protein
MADPVAISVVGIASLVVVRWLGSKVGDWLPQPGRPLLTSRPDLERVKRIEQSLAVPMDEVIAAAERRATHPDEPLPSVLADLDPETWTQPSPVLPIPVVVDTAGFRDRLRVARVLVPHITRSERLCTEQAAGGVKPLTKLVVGSRVVRSESPYADCDHEDADREDLMSWGSTGPIRSFVTGCKQCETQRVEGKRQHEYRH